MDKVLLEKEIGATSYPGRGIVVGVSPSGKTVHAGYFIMGRSENSRNRIFVRTDDGIRTEAFDPAKLEDPSLIIYAPVRKLGDDVIITNGDQTDTIYEEMKKGKTFEESLRGREFEPDEPNYTPRISAILHAVKGSFSFEMSILKSSDGDAGCCCRYHFSYDRPLRGEGRFIHTYMGNGSPLPSFEGEPQRVAFEDETIDGFTDRIWEALNDDNKVSLYTYSFNFETGDTETRIMNKNK